jgi:hypothetical protein
MEAYRGLAVLTTNMRTALDAAFLRRIRFAVQFPFPDARLRATIWRQVFPAAGIQGPGPRTPRPAEHRWRKTFATSLRNPDRLPTRKGSRSRR